MSRRVLITGGTGFVGSHVVEAYAAAGWHVRVLVRNPAKRPWENNYPVETRVGTLENQAALQGCDVIVHCAAVTKTPHVEEYYRVNSDAVKHLAENAQSARVRRFVLCSTQAASGPALKGRASLEDDPPNPLTDYGKSKLAGERNLINASRNMEWVILRPPSILGPRDEQFIPLFRGVVKWGRYPEFGDVKRAYSYIYVKDFARALLLAGETKSGLNNTYFTAHDEALEWDAAAAYIARLANRRIRPLKISANMLRLLGRVNDLYSRVSNQPVLLNSDKVKEILSGPWICSTEKIRRAWGFKCEYSTERALGETLEAYQRAGLV